jgi:hypothetical protein
MRSLRLRHRNIMDSAAPALLPLAAPLKPKTTTVQLLVDKLQRYEHRFNMIEAECDTWIAQHGEEPCTVTRIMQITKGDYDMPGRCPIKESR